MGDTGQPARAASPKKAHLTFALPIELRKIIYHHLLHTSPNQTKLLFHDKTPDHRHLDLHPAILRVSRQTYADAVPILYGDNTFKISLRGVTEESGRQVLLDHCLKPANFLRSKAFQPTPETQSGLISRSALHSLRHLELDFSYDSFWGSAHQPYLSMTAELILEILDILGRGPSATDPVVFDKERTLRLKIYSDAQGKCLNRSPPGLTGKEYPRFFSSYVQDMVFLLENLGGNTKVTLFEVVGKPPRGTGGAVFHGNPVTRQVEFGDLVVPSASE